MSDEKVEIFAKIGDERIELILPGNDWTFDEAKLAKTVSEGMAPVEIEERLLVGDPDAWLAVLRVSYLRADREWPAAKVSGAEIVSLIDAVLDAVKEATKRRPPTNPNGNEPDEPGASSTESQSLETISETGGNPT